MSKVRLSPSRVNDFNNCPQLYKYRAIDQLPEKISLDAERGTLVHSILHDLFDSPAAERTFLKAVELLPEIWSKQQEEKPELAALIPNSKEWSDRVYALLETYFELEQPQSFEATFREIHVELDLRDDVYLHGYVDRLDVAPSGEVRIVDYKTGKAPKPGWEDKALFQLRIYALVYWRTQGVIPKLLQLIYLGDGQILKNSPSESDLRAAENALMRVADDIIQSTETNTWRPKPSRLCDWCSFKDICPAFKG